MSTVIQTILTLILAVLPRLTDNATITSVINALVQLVPVIVKEVKEVLPMVQKVIDLLRTKDLTSEQLDQVDAISVEVDAAYDAAIAAFDKENPSDGD